MRGTKFSNFAIMKIGQKMTLGFGAVTGVTAILGITAFLMFRNVDSEVSKLNDHSLPVVQHSTGVERSAFECILDQKDYVIKPSDQTHEKARKDVAGLLGNLDKVDSVASRYNDEALAAKSKEVRKISVQWAALYEKGVAAIKASKAAEALMGQKGELVGQQASEYIESKNIEYMQAKRSLATVNHINTVAFTTRMHEKSYMLEGDASHFNELVSNIGLLNADYDKLQASNPDPTEQKLIADARAATRDYLAAAESWRKLNEKLKSIKGSSNSETIADLEMQMRAAAKSMDDGGDTVARCADQYQIAKTKKTDMIADAVFLVSDIASLVPTARLTSRKYMMTQDPAVWQELMNQLASLQKLYADLRKLSTSPEDIARIDAASNATLEYQDSSKEWGARDDELRKKILPEMDRIGELVLGTALEAEKSAWKDSGASSDKVQTIVTTSKTVSIVSLLVGCVVGAVIAVGITRSIIGPLKQGVGFSERIARGDLTQTLDIHRSDEIGQLATSMNSMVSGLRENMRSIAQNAQSLSSSAEELSSVSTQVSSAAEETASQANLVSSAAEQVSKNVGTVATGSEEMTASIREIAKNASEAAKVASHAATVAENTNVTVAKLGDSSVEIGNVIKVITSIAEQTNLLALNATIEAARAGEAGKGFAVVAGEVKELAKQTARATEEISSKIKTIQDDTQGAVDAIKEISTIIAQINQIQTIIASSVEEQAATTREISKNVNEAATGATEIAKNIGSVSLAAKGTTEGATQTSTAAHELARLSGELKKVVEKFKID